MPIIQQKFYVPDDIATGLATGKYSLFGGVVRWATGTKRGQIVKHLKPMNTSVADEASGFLTKAAQYVSTHKKGFVIGGVTFVVAVAGGATAVYFKLKEPSVVRNFKKALSVYIEAIRNGNMSLEQINSLYNALENLRQHKNFKKFSVKLSAEEIDTVVSQICEYTMTLAKNNNFHVNEDEMNGKNISVLSLQKYLSIQKDIFEQVA